MSREEEVEAVILDMAPRSLKEPVSWKFSALKKRVLLLREGRRGVS